MTYIVGSHWFICDVCGQKYRSTEKKKRWDGLIVCPADNEADHPQKYIRVESDGQAVPDPRPRPEDVFALPVYCTPVTRTAAADDGTADCMTVDYRLNINYAEYGGYQPIISNVNLPMPILLDTFTAANGTDPTTRDMDVHPAGAGAARWRYVPGNLYYVVGGTPPDQAPTGETFYTLTAGKISDNALKPNDRVTLTTGTFAPSTTWDQGISLQARTDDNAEILAGYGGICLLLFGWEGLNADSSPTNVLNLLLRDDAFNVYAQISLKTSGGIQGEAYDLTTGATLSATVANTAKRVALYVSGSDIVLICNGAIVQSAGFGLSSPVSWTTVELYGENPYVSSGGKEYQGAYIDKVGIYQGLTLAEALALTT